ncbi:MAG: hypothetical protein QW622_03425 [Candidatus Pacearchaeota archaeon]
MKEEETENKEKDTVSFRFEIDKEIWEKFKLTIPPNVSIREAIIMLIIKRIKEIEGDDK